MPRGKTNTPDLTIRPLTPGLMDEMGKALKGSWGSSCWCMFPRLTDKDMRELPGEGKIGPRRRAAMTKLARRRSRAPGLLAFEDNDPVGWIAVAPRSELGRVQSSRATPPVDEADVWVIPCLTVRPGARGRGVAIALIKAAVSYATSKGAPVVEAYPRAGSTRTGNDNAYFGTEPLFRHAGFEVVRGPLENTPRNWIPRVAMRASGRQHQP
jgi:GNAT superfamily N-acetyltransferase